MEKTLDLLNQGIKLRYKTWWWGRYIHKKGNKIIMENGEPYPDNQIGEFLNEEWEIYNNTIHNKRKET